MLALDGVELKFTPQALHAIAEQAISRNTGARGLRSIIENVMRDIMFEIPSRDNVAKVTVNKKTVVDGVEPEVELTNEQAS